MTRGGVRGIARARGGCSWPRRLGLPFLDESESDGRMGVWLQQDRTPLGAGRFATQPAAAPVGRQRVAREDLDVGVLPVHPELGGAAVGTGQPGEGATRSEKIADRQLHVRRRSL
jgi:hypothetical protein